MTILEDFYGYGTVEKELCALFEDQTLLRARDFFLAHSTKDGEYLPWDTLRYMNRMSLFLGEVDDTGVFAQGQATGSFLKDKLSILFLSHDNENGQKCPYGESCVDFNGIMDTIVSICHLSGESYGRFCEPEDRIEEIAMRSSLHRFLDIMADDPESFFEVIALFAEAYYPFGDNMMPLHLKSICDLYDTMPAEDRKSVHPEVIMKLTTPSSGQLDVGTIG